MSLLAFRVIVVHSPPGIIEGETCKLSLPITSEELSSPKHPESDARHITMTINSALATSMLLPTSILLLKYMVDLFPFYGTYFPVMGYGYTWDYSRSDNGNGTP
jgi:hypothetical protein